MRIEILDDAELVAGAAAKIVATHARKAIAERGRFLFAVSGGRTPWIMLRALADEELDWDKIHLFQVDERIAPADHPDRNLTHLRESFLARTAFPEANLHAMPVEVADSVAAVEEYALTLQRIAGAPAILDLIHLGLGPDGHTASLIPGDPILDESQADVGLTGVYQGRRRMTLTYPLIDRARAILWLVTGADKIAQLSRLLAGDKTIPAGRVKPDNGLILADRAAMPNDA